MPSQRMVLYERAGCHLCEEAALELDRLVGSGAYRRVDIETDDELLLRYGHRIPVISVDGVDRLEAPISTPDLRELVGSLSCWSASRSSTGALCTRRSSSRA